MYLLEREWTTAEGQREHCVLIGEGVDHSRRAEEHCVLIGEGVDHCRREEGTLCIYWRGSGP